MTDVFWIQRATPSFFQRPAAPPRPPRFGAPRPERPRDPANPVPGHGCCRHVRVIVGAGGLGAEPAGPARRSGPGPGLP